MKRLLVLFLVFIFFASPVFALLSGLKPETKNNLVKISSDIIVPHGTTVKSAFALNGNVNVSGIVQEDVVSFGGNIFLDKNSKDKSYWKVLDLKKKKIEEYYRQF